jgi:hypothetical protein
MEQILRLSFLRIAESMERCEIHVMRGCQPDVAVATERSA